MSTVMSLMASLTSAQNIIPNRQLVKTFTSHPKMRGYSSVPLTTTPKASQQTTSTSQ